MATQLKISKDDFLQMMLKKAYTKEEPTAPEQLPKIDPKEIEKLVNELKAKKTK